MARVRSIRPSNQTTAKWAPPLCRRYVPPARTGSAVGALEPAAGSRVTATTSPASIGALRTIVNTPPEALRPAAVGRWPLITHASQVLPVGGLESFSTRYGSPLRG